ncbi:helix-turn-helix domain-containing protein [Halomonas sp. 3A7M]|uniref:helix-turn-helix domain-containing protein n=1 Tax=Halomonas sp. 3A7M TaxID=2742616 RepID=UPI001865F42F|nr:helix-turn-helix transcriptional regulator [Halomonas sp. 3A7M]
MSEIRKTYEVEGVAVSIRDATQMPFSQWLAPSGGEISAALQATGWTAEKFAKESGISSRSVRRWINEESEIPYAVWAMLCAAAGWGHIWES